MDETFLGGVASQMLGKADRQQLLQWILAARLRDLLHQQTPDRLHLPEDYARRIPHSILHFPSVAWHITANDGVGTQGRPERIPATVSGVCYGSSPHWTAGPSGDLCSLLVASTCKNED